jgi:hypothetical protein
MTTQFNQLHNAHNLLIDLLFALQQQPTHPRQSQEFPALAMQHAEIWRQEGRVVERTPDMWTRDMWTNYCAFIAKVVARGLREDAEDTLSFGFALSGLNMIHDVLEFPYPTAIMSNHLPGAAAWLLEAGQWYLDHEGMATRTWAGDAKIHQLYQGPDQLCYERWKFWQERLLQLSSEEEFSVETRVVCSLAAQKMELLGNSKLDRSEGVGKQEVGFGVEKRNSGIWGKVVENGTGR